MNELNFTLQIWFKRNNTVDINPLKDQNEILF